MNVKACNVAGTTLHTESWITYGMDKKYYAIGKYEATYKLYNIFEEIFCTRKELKTLK